MESARSARVPAIRATKTSQNAPTASKTSQLSMYLAISASSNAQRVLSKTKKIRGALGVSADVWSAHSRIKKFAMNVKKDFSFTRKNALEPVQTSSGLPLMAKDANQRVNSRLFTSRCSYSPSLLGLFPSEENIAQRMFLGSIGSFSVFMLWWESLT